MLNGVSDTKPINCPVLNPGKVSKRLSTTSPISSVAVYEPLVVAKVFTSMAKAVMQLQFRNVKVASSLGRKNPAPEEVEPRPLGGWT